MLYIHSLTFHPLGLVMCSTQSDDATSCVEQFIKQEIKLEPEEDDFIKAEIKSEDVSQIKC